MWWPIDTGNSDYEFANTVWGEGTPPPFLLVHCIIVFYCARAARQAALPWHNCLFFNLLFLRWREDSLAWWADEVTSRVTTNVVRALGVNRVQARSAARKQVSTVQWPPPWQLGQLASTMECYDIRGIASRGGRCRTQKKHVRMWRRNGAGHRK